MRHEGMRTTQQGFSLIELLVALVILAVGILGIAGLQVVALQQNRGALYRAEATMIANDVMDRIRVNRDTTYDTAINDDPPALADDCRSTDCSPDEMAEYDIAQWKCSINDLDADGNPFDICTTLGIEGALPGGAGAINLAGDVYEVTVQWTDRNGNVWVGIRRELMLMAHASRMTLVTVEEIRDDDFLADDKMAAGTIPALYVDRIAEVPRGGDPVGLTGLYPADEAAVKGYMAAARTEDGFADWAADHLGLKVLA